MKNAQGDVLQIRSKWGTTLVEYEYDAWGNCSIVYTHSAYGSFGEINPIRYRSYFYDFETGFYYLQSRYYDPAIRRFISADAYVSTGQGFIGCNMFAYCNNNPINLIDYSGQSVKTAFWGWLSSGWSIALAEPTVVGEIIYVGGALALGVAAIVETVLVVEAAIYNIGQYAKAKESAALSSAIALMNFASTAATPPPPNQGGKGTQTASKTLYNKSGKNGFRIDVENPGNRIGQIHLQKDGVKYYYNVVEKVFRIGSSNGQLAPKAIQQLLQDPNVIKAIAKGLTILGY